MQEENFLIRKNQLGAKALLIEKNRKAYIIFITILLVLQSGLRNVAVGADTYQYFLIFERVKIQSWSEIINSVVSYYNLDEGKDPGYTVFQKLFQYVSRNYQIYLFFVAILFFSSLGYFIYKNTRRVSDAMFAYVLYSVLFYSMFSITGIRQTVATAIALWGYELIKRKKLVFFLILIVLASTIHRSVLIFIPLYFIRNKKALKYLLISCLILLPFMFYYSNIISSFFQAMDSTYSDYQHMESLRPYTYVIMNLVVFFLGVATYKDSLKQKEYPKTHFWYAALIIATFFTTQVFQIHGFMRVIYYFSIFNILLIPHIFRLFAGKLKIQINGIRTIGIVLLLLMYIRTSIGSEYKFFWQAMELGQNYQ